MIALCIDEVADELDAFDGGRYCFVCSELMIAMSGVLFRVFGGIDCMVRAAVFYVRSD